MPKFQLLNNTPSTGYITWKNVAVVYKDTVCIVADGYTNKRYVYWDATFPNILRTSDTLPALTENIKLMFVNRNGIAFDIRNAQVIPGDILVDGSITTRHISADGISADVIKTGTLLISGTNSPQIRVVVPNDGNKYMTIGVLEDSNMGLKVVNTGFTITAANGVIDTGTLKAQNLTIKSGSINIISASSSGLTMQLGAGSNSAFVLSASSVTGSSNLDWKIQYYSSSASLNIPNPVSGSPTAYSNVTALAIGKAGNSTVGIIAQSDRAKLVYVIDKPLTATQSEIADFRTIDGRTIIPGTIPYDALYQQTKAAGSGSYSTISIQSVTTSVSNNRIYYTINSKSVTIPGTCQYYYGYYSKTVTVKDYPFEDYYLSSVNVSPTTSSVTVSWSKPSSYSVNTTVTQTTYAYYRTDTCPTDSEVLSYGTITSTDYVTETRTGGSNDFVVLGGYVTLNINITIPSGYAGRNYKVTLTANSGSCTINHSSSRDFFGVVPSDNVIRISANILPANNVNLTSMSFSITAQVMNLTNYIQPVSLPGYVVFATSGTPAVDSSGNTPSGYLDGTDSNVFPTLLPGYVQNYFDAAWGSAVANTGIVYVYELDKVFGSAKNVQVFIRFWDDRYAVYSYNGTSWSKVSSSTTYTTDGRATATVSNCLKVAIAYTNASGTPGGIEFALRIY
jgi:hypothetical protein